MKTVNESFNGIIAKYGNYWDKIHLVCPIQEPKIIIKQKLRNITSQMVKNYCDVRREPVTSSHSVN